VRLDRQVRVLDGGRALLGGHPTRLLRLTPRARGLVDDRRTLRVRDRATALLAGRLLETGLAHPDVGRLPDVAEECTYVVPVRDRPAQLERLLASIPPGSPVVVVDDASLRPEPLAAVAASHGARLLVLPENLGPAGARNAGLRETATPFVVFVDSDVVLEPGTVPLLLRHFADPAVALAVPRIIGLRGPNSRTWLGRYEAARSSLDLGPHPAAVRPGTPVSWAPGACVAARAETLRSIGGFDARLRMGEDVDLCWRTHAAGLRIRYEPAARAAHDHRVAPGAWLRRKAEYGTGAAPLALRHRAHMAPAVLAPWNAVLLLALLAQRRWSAPVAAAAYAVATGRITRTLGDLPRPLTTAAALTADGTVSALSQGAALLTRHWWPAAAVGCLFSRRLRRATAVAAVLDVALERGGRADLDPVRYTVARRLDDLAYGAGVWLSAVRGRTTLPLRPRTALRERRRAPGPARPPGG
jgi:mycofactocin system glycosyltransferase